MSNIIPYEINKGSKLIFEASATIEANANLSTLSFSDALAKGLLYKNGTAVITYDDGSNTDPLPTIQYWDGTDPAPTEPYYTDSSAIDTTGDATTNPNFGKNVVNLTIVDPTADKKLLNPASNTKLTFSIPVFVQEMPESEGISENNYNYFTNNYTITADGEPFTPDELQIEFAKYICEVFGGEYTVTKTNGKDVVLKAHIPTIDSESFDALKYTITININEDLAAVEPTPTSDETQVLNPLDTPGYVYLRYNRLDGPLVDTNDYTVTASNNNRTLTFQINHNEAMKNSYIYLFVQTKTLNVTNRENTILGNTIGNLVTLSINYDATNTTDTTIPDNLLTNNTLICSDNGSYAIVHLVPSKIIVEKKIIL